MLEPEKQELIRKFLNQIETDGQNKRCCGNSPGKTHVETECVGTSPVRRPVTATPLKGKTTKKRYSTPAASLDVVNLEKKGMSSKKTLKRQQSAK